MIFNDSLCKMRFSPKKMGLELKANYGIAIYFNSVHQEDKATTILGKIL